MADTDAIIDIASRPLPAGPFGQLEPPRKGGQIPPLGGNYQCGEIFMQDKYAGDIGDYAKLGLLRELMENRKLGVAWYRVPDETGSPDGGKIGYLKNPKRYRRFDLELFNLLHNVVFGGKKKEDQMLGTIIAGCDIFRRASNHGKSSKAQVLGMEERVVQSRSK